MKSPWINKNRRDNLWDGVASEVAVQQQWLADEVAWEGDWREVTAWRRFESDEIEPLFAYSIHYYVPG